MSSWISVLDRLSLASIEVAENREATERLSSILRETELLLDDETVHQAALVCSEAFVIAWRDEESIEAYYNDPRLCHAFYDPDHPRQMQCVAKWWEGRGREDATHSLLPRSLGVLREPRQG